MQAAEEPVHYVPEIVCCGEADMEQVRCQAQPVFDLRQGSMFRTVIYQTESGLYLHLMADHMILDGDSMDLLAEDIDAVLTGREIVPEKLSFLQLCEEQKDNGEDAAAKRWFTKLLSGMKDACGLHTGEADPSGANMAFKWLSRDDVAVGQLLDRLRISVTTLFCGLLGLTLAAENGTDRSVFEISFNGRSDSRLERTVGYLVQSVPVCCLTDGKVSLADYLRGVQEQLLRSMSYAAQAPACVKSLLPECGRHLVISQRAEAEVLRMGGRDAVSIDLTGRKTATPDGLDTIFTLTPVPGGMMLSAMFDPSRYSEVCVSSVCERFDRILSAAAPDMTLQQLIQL